jgi:LmbE family N-acetylglucosaminyl deacetylase
MAILKKLKNKLNNRKLFAITLVLLTIFSVIAGLVYMLEVPPVMAQSAANSLPEVPVPLRGQKILIFSPHPDDETIAAGGYIAQAIQAGADVRIALVTDGDFHHNSQTRCSEFKKATAILGVADSNVIFMGFPDGKLDKEQESTLEDALTQQIGQFNPDIVVSPYPGDNNPDHAAIGKAVEGILKSDSHKRTVYEFLVHYEILWPRPRQYAPNYHLLPPKKLMTPGTSWETFPLSQTDENLKSAAVHVYKSQLENTWLNGLMLASIRKNELMVIPANIYGKQNTKSQALNSE